VGEHLDIKAVERVFAVEEDINTAESAIR
jgi:hypothetical protein